MQKIMLTLTLCFTAATSLLAQDKVIESSVKKMPDWAKNMAEPHYVITQGDGASVSDAQQQALLMVKQEIARSVAEQIISTSTRNIEENNQQFSESYTQNITAKASKVPYLQGISVNQIEEFYWEKIQNKKKKTTFYRYFIKYPFSKAQMSKLVAEFKEEDNKITQRINELEAALPQVESVEQIDAAVDELAGLIASLEDNRKERSAQLKTRYSALYQGIMIYEEGSDLGKISYQLVLDGRAIKTSRKPQVKSACASIGKMSLGTTCNIVYRYDGCYDDIENFIEVLYRLGGKSISHKFLIPLSEQ